MFGISGEHIIILAVVLLIFGPRRLPELGNTLGRAIRNFKDSLSGVEEATYRKLKEAEGKTGHEQNQEAGQTEIHADSKTDGAEPVIEAGSDTETSGHKKG